MSLYGMTVGKEQKLLQALHDGGWDEKVVDTILAPGSAVAAEMLSVLDLQYVRYSEYLLPLSEQLELLREYNQRFWNGRQLSEKQLKAVDTASDHVQRVDDLEILHVEGSSPGETIQLWWQVMAGTQPDHWPKGGVPFHTDAEHLRILENNTRRYEPGIHRVRINLVAHWNPTDGRSVAEVRERAARDGDILAHGEAFSGYGLHSVLLREMDGENLPYVDASGYEATFPGGETFGRAPYFYWSRVDREVRLYACRVDYPGRDYAAPVLREL